MYTIQKKLKVTCFENEAEIVLKSNSIELEEIEIYTKLIELLEYWNEGEEDQDLLCKYEDIQYNVVYTYIFEDGGKVYICTDREEKEIIFSDLDKSENSIKFYKELLCNYLVTIETLKRDYSNQNKYIQVKLPEEYIQLANEFGITV